MSPKAALARVRRCGKVFSHVKAASVFLLVSDYQAWPGRSNEELLSCQRDRETAQLLFCLIWKLNLSSSVTSRLSSSGPNTSSQSVDADFGIGIAIAPSGRVSLRVLSYSQTDGKNRRELCRSATPRCGERFILRFISC
jgi:hypothetical protein